MADKPFTIYVGGGYSVQPPHRAKILPEDYLLAFCNVNAKNQDEAVNFCNGYQVNPLWVYENQKTITTGFAEIQAKYVPIIKKVLAKEPLTYPDVLTINKALEDTTFHISPRKDTEEMILFERKFDLIVPIGQKAKVTFYGAPEMDEKKTYVEIIIEKPSSKETISYKTIKNGIFGIDKHFPDEKWQFYLKYSDRMVIETKRIGTNYFFPSRIEQKIYLQENNFTFDDLSATFSCLTFESVLCHLIWERLNHKRHDEKIKNCVTCGNLYRYGKDSRSEYYCSNPLCKADWEKRKEKEKYDQNPEFREAKQARAREIKHKGK